MHARHSRALRGVTAAAVATWIAAVSHTFGGGEAPAALLIAVVAILASPVAVALAGRRLNLGRLTLTVIASQLLLHLAFSITAGPVGAVAGHVHGRFIAFGTVRAELLLPDVGMLIAHLAAAVVTTAVLYRGERMLRALGRGIVRLLTPALDTVVTVPFRAGRAIASRPAAARRLSLTSDFSRRGPPAFVIAA